jgi:hypothetical protein
MVFSIFQLLFVDFLPYHYRHATNNVCDERFLLQSEFLLQLF